MGDQIGTAKPVIAIDCQLMSEWDAFCDAHQLMRAKHAILTAYNSPADIGAHSDKARTIFPSDGQAGGGGGGAAAAPS
jgi:hypothetical protein